MIIMTTQGPYEVWAQTRTNLNRVVVSATTLELLKDMRTSIELMGASEDDEYLGDYLHTAPDTWIMELDRTTFKLWLAFEVEHYLCYGKNELTEFAVQNETYAEQLKQVKEVIGFEKPKNNVE